MSLDIWEPSNHCLSVIKRVIYTVYIYIHLYTVFSVVVNCIAVFWFGLFSLLASGSDDVHVIIWDAFRHKALTTVRTSHTGNIFSVKVYMPDTVTLPYFTIYGLFYGHSSR